MAEAEKPLVGSLTDPRREVVARIAASESFAKSPRLRELFFYLAECALRDPSSTLTEQQVGIAVFNRPAGYDTSADTVVRVQASEVRKRLKYYFLSEGLQEPVIMELPRGSYIPVFRPREPLPDESAVADAASNGEKLVAVAQPAVFERPPQPLPAAYLVKPVRPVSLLVLTGLLIVAVAACSWLAYQNSQLRKRTAENTPYLSHFWTQFFQNHQQTEVVPSDFDLIAISDVVGRNVPLKEYSGKDYPGKLIDPLIPDPRTNYMVSKAVARGAITPYDGPVMHELSRLSERYQLRFQVDSPREVRMDAELPGNFILLGHERANPWVETFAGRLNFRHHYDDVTRRASIVNTSPLPGEKPVYVYENHQESYALVACLPRPGDKGNVLLLSGISLSAIDGAANLVTDESAMSGLYERLKIGLSDRIPYFEVLLEKKPNAHRYEILAYRIIKNP
jgi:hypothetical protein